MTQGSRQFSEKQELKASRSARPPDLIAVVTFCRGKGLGKQGWTRTQEVCSNSFIGQRKVSLSAALGQPFQPIASECCPFSHLRVEAWPLPLLP